MKDIKELRKELRMLRLEQQWLKAKCNELKVSISLNTGRMAQIRQELDNQKSIKTAKLPTSMNKHETEA